MGRKPAAYSDVQYAALEGLKDDTFSLGVARKEFVNKVLLLDGTVTDDLDVARAAVTATVARNPREAGHLPAEFEAMIAEKRFFLILTVPREPHPLIYFQCAVEGNPDLPPKKAKKAAKS